MSILLTHVEGICNDCGEKISGNLSMKPDEVGPIRVLASGTIVAEGSKHHDDPKNRESGKEHGSFVLNTEEGGTIKTIGIITAAASETYAVMMVIDEELRMKLENEMYSIRGERGL